MSKLHLTVGPSEELPQSRQIQGSLDVNGTLFSVQSFGHSLCKRDAPLELIVFSWACLALTDEFKPVQFLQPNLPKPNEEDHNERDEGAVAG